MGERNSEPSHGDSITWMLGRLDAKSDHTIRQNETLLQQSRSHMLALDRLILASKTSTQSRPRRGVQSSMQETEPHREVLHSIAKTWGLKAAMWAMGRIFGLLISYLLPTALLLWALASKWLGTGWLWVLGLLH